MQLVALPKIRNIPCDKLHPSTLSVHGVKTQAKWYKQLRHVMQRHEIVDDSHVER